MTVEYFDLNSLDLGVATSGNQKVDEAIKVLRLLHLSKLRDLQTQVKFFWVIGKKKLIFFFIFR